MRAGPQRASHNPQACEWFSQGTSVYLQPLQSLADLLLCSRLRVLTSAVALKISGRQGPWVIAVHDSCCMCQPMCHMPVGRSMRFRFGCFWVLVLCGSQTAMLTTSCDTVCAGLCCVRWLPCADPVGLTVAAPTLPTWQRFAVAVTVSGPRLGCVLGLIRFTAQV